MKHFRVGFERLYLAADLAERIGIDALVGADIDRDGIWLNKGRQKCDLLLALAAAPPGKIAQVEPWRNQCVLDAFFGREETPVVFPV